LLLHIISKARQRTSCRQFPDCPSSSYNVNAHGSQKPTSGPDAPSDCSDCAARVCRSFGSSI